MVFGRHDPQYSAPDYGNMHCPLLRHLEQQSLRRLYLRAWQLLRWLRFLQQSLLRLPLRQMANGLPKGRPLHRLRVLCLSVSLEVLVSHKKLFPWGIVFFLYTDRATRPPPSFVVLCQRAKSMGNSLPASKMVQVLSSVSKAMMGTQCQLSRRLSAPLE